MIAEQIDSQVANAKAAAGLLLMTVGRHIGVVQLVVGTKNLHPAMRLARFRPARRHQHRGTGRITRQHCRVGAVNNGCRLDFLAADQAPACRVGVAIADQVGQQQAIGIDQRTGALHRSCRPCRDDRVAVANIALADLQAGGVFEDILRIHDVHVAGLLASDLGLGRRVAGNSGWALLADSHFRQLLGILVGGGCDGLNEQGGNRQAQRF